jgi:hypothetical protein
MYLEAPNRSDKINYSNALFLAGSITGAYDWQKYAAAKLSMYDVVNPRRANYHSMDPAVEREQITWEFDQLNACRNILFWFSFETLAPITLFEYGSMLRKNVGRDKYQNIFVGIHPDYKRKNDVIIQTELLCRMSVAPKIHFDLDELIESLQIHSL